MGLWEGFRESKLRLDVGYLSLVFDRGRISFPNCFANGTTAADITKVIMSAQWPDLQLAHARPKPATEQSALFLWPAVSKDLSTSAFDKCFRLFGGTVARGGRRKQRVNPGRPEEAKNEPQEAPGDPKLGPGAARRSPGG